MTIVAGRERRPGLRRKAERVFHLLGTVDNTLFMGAVTTLICSVILIIALVYSSILKSRHLSQQRLSQTALPPECSFHSDKRGCAPELIRGSPQGSQGARTPPSGD